MLRPFIRLQAVDIHEVCLVHTPSGLAPWRLSVAMVAARLSGWTKHARKRQVFPPTRPNNAKQFPIAAATGFADLPTSIAVRPYQGKLGALRLHPLSIPAWSATVSFNKDAAGRGQPCCRLREGDRGNTS